MINLEVKPFEVFVVGRNLQFQSDVTKNFLMHDIYELVYMQHKFVMIDILHKQWLLNFINSFPLTSMEFDWSMLLVFHISHGR